MLEGTTCNVPAGGGRKRPDGVDYIPIKTDNILFICLGAFDKIGSKKDKVVTEDLIEFGMMRELLGRLPVIAKLHPLSMQDIVEILTVPKNSLVNQYKNLFKLSGCQLDFELVALDAIASFAMERNLGARGLRSIMEEVLLEEMFELPNKDQVLVTSSMVYTRLRGPQA